MRSINEDEPDLSGLNELQRGFLLPLLNKDISDRPSSEAAYETCIELIANYGRKDALKIISAWMRKTKTKRKRKRGILFYFGNSIIAFFLLIGLLFTSVRFLSIFDSPGSSSNNIVSTSSPSPDINSIEPNVPLASKSPSSTPKSSPSVLTSKSPTPKPIPSSTGSFQESPAEAAKVVTANLFGRSFEANGGLDWSVPLTNFSSEIVPPITNLQFRLIGYPNKSWLDVGYKLKVSNNGVQALVDKVLFEILFKKTVCPEFRFVRIENGLVVNIWNSGTPECATDYIP
jgi:hypothetical protein